MKQTLFLALLVVSRPAFAYVQPRPADYNALNPAAAGAVLYEVQARSANACRADTGSDAQRAACRAKVAPVVKYRAFDGDSSRCGEWPSLSQVRLGTLDDLLEDTADYQAGITLRYIHDKVGANTVWLMPVFPNNDRFDIPDACDNLGSPYAVRDYMHVSASLDRACIGAGTDEYTSENGGTKVCWGNGALDKVIAQAHGRGLRVMLDVAFNHFGHNYLFYDYAATTPVRDRLARGENLDDLWDYSKTFESALVHPELVDTADRLESAAAANPPLKAALTEIRARCPALAGDPLVRAAGMWREMLDWERRQFKCADPMNLEFAAPGFYLGQRGGGDPIPSIGIGSNFTNNWRDVKFLYHHEYHGDMGGGRGDPFQAFARDREYLFRVMNYWVSRGVDGFRLDHTTDPDGGMGPNEWKYLIGKVNYYDWVRKGRPAPHVPPIYLAEEFGDQLGMNHVVDILTEGYVGDIRGGDGATKNASYVERVLQNDSRFGGHALVMHGLETHDERRLYDGTGFNPWTGAGFWGVGASSRGAAMLLMGQEFGESWGLGFRKSTILQSRFVGTSNFRPEGYGLIEFYRQMNAARQDFRNRALLSPNRYFLRSRHTGVADERIFAQARWDGDNAVFVFHNLWETPEESVEQSYFLPPELAGQLMIRDDARYKLVDALSGRQAGDCRSGADLKWDFYVKLARAERLQWLRLEQCN